MSEEKTMAALAAHRNAFDGLADLLEEMVHLVPLSNAGKVVAVGVIEKLRIGADAAGELIGAISDAIFNVNADPLAGGEFAGTGAAVSDKVAEASPVAAPGTTFPAPGADAIPAPAPVPVDGGVGAASGGAGLNAGVVGASGNGGVSGNT